MQALFKSVLSVFVHGEKARGGELAYTLEQAALVQRLRVCGKDNYSILGLQRGCSK